MNITVLRLDDAYEQCSGLVGLINGDGANLLSSLASTIADLKKDWIGNDATVHINGLIDVHKNMYNILADAKESVAYAASRVIAMQETRNKNGGAGNIGATIDGKTPELEPIPTLEQTEIYKVFPEANNDLNELKDECTRFESFVVKFLEQKDDLMSNWQEGALREKAETAFNTLESNYGTYKKIMTSARDNLEIAINNLKEVNKG